MLITLAALALAASPADDQRAEVERAVFDLCPRAMTGTLAWADPAQVRAAGYTPTAPQQTANATHPRAVRNQGTDRIVISSSSGERAICSVWFGGPENTELAEMVRSRASANGYEGSGPHIGDGPTLYLFRREGEMPATLILIEADTGGQLGFYPATTVVILGRRY